MRPGHIRDPQAILEQSRAQAAAEDLAALPADLHGIARRLIHARGDAAVAAGLRGSPGAAAAGTAALARGGTVLADAAMVAAGISRARLPDGVRILCTLGLGGVADRARRRGLTRSAAAVELWPPWLDGAVVAVGNAPTALFRLLEGVGDSGWPLPALVIGMPVGFVGAAAAKDALAAQTAVPWIALTGNDGGSALAAAAVNALAGGPA